MTAYVDVPTFLKILKSIRRDSRGACIVLLTYVYVRYLDLFE
jgi:hypothetical protein